MFKGRQPNIRFHYFNMIKKKLCDIIKRVIEYWDVLTLNSDGGGGGEGIFSVYINIYIYIFQ